MPRYRFSGFILSPRRRVLIRDGRELPLIPRYFDLLVFLIERRHEAVHKQAIFDRVWTDVIVSDSALSQAVRTIRRTLEDDSRDPRFIRTVSRHGYRFVCDDVVEEDDERPWQTPVEPEAAATSLTEAEPDPFEPLFDRVTRLPRSPSDEEEQREAAELLHALGTAEALTRLGTRQGHVLARALMRDTRWDAVGAARVPVIGSPSPVAVARALVAIRVRRAARMVALRWASASIGGGLSGLLSGLIGGLLLAVVPDSTAPLAVAPVLAVIGGASGAIAAAGVGAGLCMAEAAARSRRALALVCGAALGGTLVGMTVQWIGRSSLVALVGLNVALGGTLEGLVLGGAAGLGYAIGTRGSEGGMAAPTGRRRLHAALTTAAVCGLAALALTLAGRPLVGGTVHAIARAAHGAQVSLAPLGRLIGEPDFGPISQAIIGGSEGAIFGLGLALGLTHRPKEL